MIIQKYNARSPVLGELSAGLRGLFANQCPLSGGAAVFTARSLYYLVDPNISYDDRLLCLQEGVILREQNKSVISNYYKVYPNPTSNQVYINYNVEEDDQTIFLLYDGVGKLLLKKNLNPHQNELVIQVTDYENGIYFYEIVTNKNKDVNGKIVITK